MSFELKDCTAQSDLVKIEGRLEAYLGVLLHRNDEYVC